MNVSKSDMTIESNLFPLIVDISSYLDNNNHVGELDNKLQILLKRGNDLLNNPLIEYTNLNDNEKYFFESVMDMSEYIMSIDKKESNISPFLRDLLSNFFDFIDVIIRYSGNMMSSGDYNQLFNEYNELLRSQEEYFNSEIMMEDDEASEEFIKTIEEDSSIGKSFKNMNELKKYIESEL